MEALRLELSLERITDTARQLIVDADDDISYFEPLFEALESVPKPWIVRSSAIGEDGAQGSFAGQLESIGGVTTHKELIQALKTCWASRWSTRVLSYERALKRELQGSALWFRVRLHPRLPVSSSRALHSLSTR